MDQEEMQQFRIQICKLVAKLQYLSSVVNLFTEGYSKVEYTKEWDNIKFEFSPNLSNWKTRYEDVKGELVEENLYLRLNETKEWIVKERRKVIPKLLAAIRALEEYINNPNEFDFKNEFYWYTETIKFKVFELDYQPFVKS